MSHSELKVAAGDDDTMEELVAVKQQLASVMQLIAGNGGNPSGLASPALTAKERKAAEQQRPGALQYVSRGQILFVADPSAPALLRLAWNALGGGNVPRFSPGYVGTCVPYHKYESHLGEPAKCRGEV